MPKFLKNLEAWHLILIALIMGGSIVAGADMRFETQARAKQTAESLKLEIAKLQEKDIKLSIKDEALIQQMIAQYKELKKSQKEDSDKIYDLLLEMKRNQ